MNKADAKILAEKELERYRVMPYSKIAARLEESENFERVNEKGEEHRVEVEFFVDDEIERNIRVIAAISYSLWTDLSPVCSDFMIAPDGRFIGE